MIFLSSLLPHDDLARRKIGHKLLLLLLQLLCHFPLLMSYLVLYKVVGSDEAVTANGARKFLVTSVSTTVT